MYSIEVTNLTKIYKTKTLNKGTIKALDNVSFKIEKGTIFGLLGPNGAGKTTLVKILLGIVHQTSGSAKLLGEDVRNYLVRSKIGYLPENHKFPSYLTGEDVLKYYAKLTGFDIKNNPEKISEYLNLVKMDKWRKTKIKKYSKGMMQRLGLAQAMIHNPEIIFLDEPTDGVDPIGRKEIRDILIELKNKGKTVFINSHLLSEVELVSDKVGMLNNGKLIKLGSVEELTTSKEIYEINISEQISEILINELRKNYSFNIESKKILLENSEMSKVNIFMDELRKSGITITSFNRKKDSLEDMFIKSITEENK